jgi:hypothetical protein
MNYSKIKSQIVYRMRRLRPSVAVIILGSLLTVTLGGVIAASSIHHVAGTQRAKSTPDAQLTSNPSSTPVPSQSASPSPSNSTLPKPASTTPSHSTNHQAIPSTAGQPTLPLVLSHNSLTISAGNFYDSVLAHLTKYVNDDGTISDDEIICSLSGQTANGGIHVGFVPLTGESNSCSNGIAFAVYVEHGVPSGAYNLKVGAVTKLGQPAYGYIQVTVPPAPTPAPQH